MPHEEEALPRRLSPDDLKTLLEATPSEHRLLVDLALTTGLRFGELKRLTWSHVVWKPRPHLALEGTKSGRVRRVPLSLGIVQELRKARVAAREVLVLPNCPRNTMALRKRIRKTTGLQLRFHDLRHTFASRYVESGGSLAMLQLILGHSTSRMTERYARSSDSAMFLDAERVFQAQSATEVVTGVVSPGTDWAEGEA